MPEIPRTKFNSPWTVAVIEAVLNDVSSAKGSSESLTAALNAMRAEINSLSGGVHLKGAVDYYADLPSNPSEGDAYTVRYQGTSGTDPFGIEYAWENYQGTPEWIPIGVDPSVFAKQTEMNVVANAGAKNVLQFDTLYGGGTSYTTAGVKFDILSDGSVKAERVSASTSVANTILKIGGNNVCIDNFCNGKFILSGCPSGGGSSTYELMSSITGGAYTKRDYGSGVLLTDKGSYSDIYVQCTVRSSFDGTVIFKPMIRPAEITDPTFQPYARTNRELTVLTDEDRAALVEIVDGGAKNISTINNGNNGTLRYIEIPLTAAAGDYVLRFGSLTSTDTDATTCNVAFFLGATRSSDNVKISRGTNITQIISTTGADSLRVYASDTSDHSQGDTVTISDFMVCSKAAWDVSHQYEPYAPTNRELYEDKASVDEVYGTTTTIAPASGETYDLDDLPIGRFQVTSSTYAARITHSPTTDSGYDIECRYNGSSSYKTQIALPNRSGSVSYDIWVRHYGTTWSDWLTVLTTEDIDSTPTAGSTNPVSSGGVWADQQRQETEIGVIANAGAKNFVQVLFTSIAATSTNPSITNNGDGSITINGIRTGENYIPVYDLESDITSSVRTRYTLPAGKYVATTINRTSATLQVYMHDGTNIKSLAQAASHDIEFEYTAENKQTYPYICFRLNVSGSQSGIVYNNVKIYPMVCTKTAWDISSAFAPYAKTNRELTVITDEDRAALVEIVDGGAKNLVKNDPASTLSGISVSLSADGKLVINGNTGNSAQSVYCTCYLDAGTYVLSGCPSGGGTSNYQCELRTSTGASTGYADTGDTVTFTITYAGYYRYNVRIAAGYTATDLTIPAMICTQAAWDVSQKFVPYRPSWQEMYDMILAIQSGGNRALTMQTEPEEQEER